MFKYLQSRIRATPGTGPGAPPPDLIAFYWHFVRQTRGWYALMFATSLAVALIDTVIPVFIGKLVSLMEAADRHAALAQQSTLLLGMAALILVVRPLATFAEIAIRQSGGFLAPDVVATETATEPPEEPPPDEIRVEAV